MKLYVARHGQSIYNLLKLNNAEPATHVPLSKKGEREASKLADDLSDVAFSVIYVSELKRTQQTAKIINEFHKVKIRVDRRLNDNKTGFEGKTYDEYNEELESKSDMWNAHLNGGESIMDVNLRVKNFLDDLSRDQSKTVLIVTSLMIIQQIESIVYGYRQEKVAKFIYETGTYHIYNI